MEHSIHGGDIYRNNVKLDYSVNINPVGIDGKIKTRINMNLDALEHYPDPEQMRLKSALGRKFDIFPDNIVCGNGASELFLAIVHALTPKKIVCPVPSFYGYERVAWAAGAELRCYQLKEENDYDLDSGILEMLKSEVDLLFLTNPNNPVGNRIENQLLEEILRTCRENNIWVVLDECFIEFLGHSNYDVKERLHRYPNLMIVRAFTKYFAIPGIRLGYMMSWDENLLNKIRLNLPEWNISVLAETAGVAALECEEVYENTGILISRERTYLETFIKRAFMESGKEIRIYRGEANFILIKTDFDLYSNMLERGILIRDCSNFRGLGTGYYRIAVKSHEDNEIFIDTLENCLND